jgi:hypothetical protein
MKIGLEVLSAPLVRDTLFPLRRAGTASPTKLTCQTPYFHSGALEQRAPLPLGLETQCPLKLAALRLDR